jgi:two-component system LytT family sensor kinase
VCCAVLIAYAWKKRFQSGAGYFIALAAVILFVNVTYIGELNSDTLFDALLWSNIDHLALPFHPYFWLLMCLDYTQAVKRKRLVRNVLLLFPALYYFIFYTNSQLHLYITEYHFISNGYFPVLYSDKGPGFALIIALITVIGTVCSVLYLRGYLKSALLHRSSYLLMFVASLFPWATIYLNVSNTNYLGIDYYSFFIIVTAILYLFGIFRYHLFSTVPIATETVFRLSEDAIAISDIDGYIMDINESFQRYYPELRQMKKGLILYDFLRSHAEFSDLSQENPEENFQKQVDGAERYFSARLTPINSETGIEIGMILFIKDITIFLEHQNQLKLIADSAMLQAESNELSFLQAQISPHFINNTLSTIGSMISRDDEKARDLVVDLSEYLISCYRTESSPMAPLAQELDAVNTYIRIVKARFGERISFSVESGQLPSMELPRLVLQPLIENAVRHGVQPKKEGGSVRLVIRKEENYAHFEIIDDGVGIEPGRIINLLKGSDTRQGVGIININKRLMRYFGEGLSIVSNGGTVVSFRVPLLQDGHKGETEK